ncbi:MAG TPA: YafY family protein [Gammaproteobacteria bacterium]|jgi:predicted DNA-binding transcriptional regulator YafY|nr:YafY family protein [Gammaproteobacteria bacterium]
MSRPTTRVLAVLELLQTHGRMSGAELARRLEVDGRTLRRYIAALEDLGIPITSERGRHGAYLLVAGFKLPPMMFNEDEALALSVGLLAARSLGLAEANSAVASAQAKLERVMPANLKQRVRAVDETVSLDLSSAPPPGNNQALAVLSAAAQQGRRVHMRYRSSKGEGSERDFDAYGLLYRKGCWYVGGHCHLRQGLRSFRLDRVEEVEMLEARFTRPEDFDAGAHLDFSIATLPRATPVEVWLETDLKTAMLELGENIGLFEPQRGGVLFKTHTDGIEWMARQLAQLSFRFEIRAPASLRGALRRHAAGLKALA